MSIQTIIQPIFSEKASKNKTDFHVTYSLILVNQCALPGDFCQENANLKISVTMLTLGRRTMTCSLGKIAHRCDPLTYCPGEQAFRHRPEKNEFLLDESHLTIRCSGPFLNLKVAPSDASTTYLCKTSQERLFSGVSARLPAPLHPCVDGRKSAFSLSTLTLQRTFAADGVINSVNEISVPQ